ncbi:hypothetical protein [Argonema galeatum]|uniref:hypothetical protein n=1 Tax=Argonema galeatum TaxID=2942762 RepID=UPI0020121B9D|nr:hypothetical protein [Argonema galeatum]MCL1465501.1 hypothetical protein [Argonema galeatum A003/A1]
MKPTHLALSCLLCYGRGAEGQRGRGAEGQRRKEIKMFLNEQKHNNSERARKIAIAYRYLLI